MSNWRTVLVSLGALLAATQAIHAPFDEVVAPGLTYAIVVAAAAFWVWRSQGITAPVVLGLLAAIELLMVIFVYPNADQPPAEWVLWLFGLLTLAVTAAAIACIATRSKRATAES
jgi:hypothetical protein